MPSIEYQPVESSQVKAWGYDPASETLGVQFRNGGTYHYTGVPQSVADALAKAESIGRFVGAEVRGRFPYERQPDENGIVYGLSLKQEPKYTVSPHGRLVNRASAKPIPDDEPVFVLRAQDRCALIALEAYRAACEYQDHREVVGSRIAAFQAFAMRHHARMKEPDSSAAEMTTAGVVREEVTA